MKEIQIHEWNAVGTLPYQADFSRHLQEGVMLPNQTPWFPAHVPGSIYRDLQEAGLIQDPYYGENSLACEWVAGRWWVYRTTFSLDEADLQETLLLTFQGIDYSAQIYLNGTRLGHHEGMYIPFSAVVNEAARAGENVLVCVLEHAPLADPQPGYTSKTRYLKARFNYKWDFAARLINLGLYEEVTLRTYRALHVTHHFFRPVKTDAGWRLECAFEAEGYRECDGYLQVTAKIQSARGPAGEKVFRTALPIKIRKGPNAYSLTLPLPGADPLLWWPNGYGEQPLHEVTAYFFADCPGTADDLAGAGPAGQHGAGHPGAPDDTVRGRIGFRTLSYQFADGREDALPYNVVINGKRIYLKGTNLVPLDCRTGVPEETVRRLLQAAKEANVNYLRIWGGGHIESELFYDLCDTFGLMVLQEFPMSSSGCDDVPSRDPQFLALLEKAALHAVKQKRNHVSLIAMDGGNELTDERYLGRPDHEAHPATFDDPTLAMLKGIVNAFAPDIQFYPSSASGPNALLKIGDTGNNHDVHGPWGYLGVYEHYDFYNRSDSIIHGEFGCGGMANEESLRRFLPPEKLRLATSDADRTWAHHSGGWDNYAVRERLMFGDLYDLPFPDYIRVSQFIQAEALRYALEANRRRQWKNVGEMTWQFNEPWPNIQCSSLVDYYGGRKLAYYFLKDAYAPVLASMRYRRLFYCAGDVFEASLHLLNDRKDASYLVECTLCERTRDQADGGWRQGRTLFRQTFSGVAKEDVSMEIGSLSVKLPEDLTGAFSVILKTECGDFLQKKEYLLLIADREVPVSPTDLDLLRAKTERDGKLPALFDAKRADPGPVIDYVRRMRASCPSSPADSPQGSPGRTPESPQ